MSDWGLDWELPEYPQLPKLFTNAKTAKKRKHKEFIVTEELLEQPVKLSKLSGTASQAAKAHQQQAATAAADASLAQKQKSKKGAKLQQQQQQQQQQETVQQLTQAADGEQIVSSKPTADKKTKKKVPGDNADNMKAVQQQHSQLQSEHSTVQADEQQQQHPQRQSQGKSGKKEKRREKQQPLVNGEGQAGAGDVAGGPALAVDDTAVLTKQKKCKNKFKQAEFLAQQRQLQQVKPVQVPLQQQQQQPTEQQAATQPPQNAHPVTGPPTAAAGVALKHKKQRRDKQKLQQQQPAATEAVSAPAAAAAQKSSAAGTSGGSKLLQQFKERLAGSRFRQLNEALYTQPGKDSFNQMQQQPELFTQYHEGFQQQVKSWPTQPLDVAIKWLKDKPAEYVVVDYGCGEARLAAAVKQSVHSLDLVAAAPGVIACNMAQSPLAAGSCDAAVFSLALMGTDYGEFLLDAARVLKEGGWLWIAEVRSRFVGGGGSEDFRPFLSSLQQLGFRLIKQDSKNKMFVVLVLKKQQPVDAAAASRIQWPSLKACVYKKR